MLLRFFLVIVSLLSFSSAQMFQSVAHEDATLIQSGEAKQYCPNCGMDLVKFHKTNHTHENHQYCSLHCLFEATKGQIPSDAKVVDAKNLGFIDAQKAFYVVGSSVAGTMTMNSKYAFVSKEDAQEFMRQNGGKMVNFQEAYAIASEDFSKDQAMLKHKRESEVYTKGKKMYDEACEKVDANLFQTIAELKVSLKRVCKLEQEAQFQAVAIYLWDKERSTQTTNVSQKIIVPKDAKCPICGMFVAKYPQWAAVIEDGKKSVYFDGVKDMMKYIFTQKKNFETIYVSDYYRLNKIEAHKAFYVVGSNVYGPMGSELIPFATEKEALNFSRDHNGKKVLGFNEITEVLVKSL